MKAMLSNGCVVLVLLAACNLPHVEPLRRTYNDQHSAVASIYTSCSEDSPFNGVDWPDNQTFDPPIVRAPSRRSAGVVVSERYILTAAHAVSCPIIPDVYVTLSTGQTVRAVVERDDAMYGSGTDIARLELWGGGSFGLGIAPPVLTTAHEGSLCVVTARGSVCGLADGSDTIPVETREGDSGAGIYEGGALAGLVVGGSAHSTRFVRITPVWLEGT